MNGTTDWMLAYFATVSLLLSTMVSPSSSIMHEVTVCSYNLWNVMFSWEVRLHYIANLVKAAGCEVLVLQEVRFHEDESWSQVLHLARLLPRHRWATWRSAGKASKPSFAFWKGWEKEGLAVLSQWPLGATYAEPLSAGHGPDTSKRLAFHVPVDIGSKVRVHIIAVHFSYIRQQQCQNAADVVNYISRSKLDNVVVVGDFNVYPDFPDPVKLFTDNDSNDMRLRSKCFPQQDLRNSRSSNPLQDVWVSANGPHVPGFTFSNMPHPGLVSRPDRILASSQMSVQHSAVYGNGSEYGQSRKTDILLNRAWRVLLMAKSASLGYSGYPCLQDCGPNGVCRCGVCVNVADSEECLLPDCQECSPMVLLEFCGFAAAVAVLAALTVLALLKVLLVSARFDQSTAFTILGCNCCLCNMRLFAFSAFTPRHCLGRCLRCIGFGRLPPFVMLFLCLSLLGMCLLTAATVFSETLNTVSDVMPEELRPSDHLMLSVNLRVFS